jgi:hypothetical protein
MVENLREMMPPNTDYRALKTSLTKEPVVGIIAWIILGLGADLQLAFHLVSGRNGHRMARR